APSVRHPPRPPAGGDGAPPSMSQQVIDALVTRADGVPLYVEELTKAVAEPGAARGADAIPSTLAGSLMARLDRLSTAKEVAQRGGGAGGGVGRPPLGGGARDRESGPAPGARPPGGRGGHF